MKVHKLGGSREPSWHVEIHEAAKKELLDLTDDEFDRVDAHLAELENDPLRPRPGMDITKLKDVDEGSLYRLRVGEHRAAYLVVSEDRTVTVLVIEDREVGYKRIIARAMARMRG
jgi:mRNA-degrading endonuclease RelE of RelBE toxin-antitoxin system